MAAGKKTGGRQKGVKNKTTVERDTFARSVAEAAANQGESPLEYMLRVMRTSEDDKRRDAMAVAAAAYVHPRLAAIEHTGETTHNIVTDKPLSADEWQNAHADPASAN
jgi:hypothetical protein